MKYQQNNEVENMYLYRRHMNINKEHMLDFNKKGCGYKLRGS